MARKRNARKKKRQQNKSAPQKTVAEEPVAEPALQKPTSGISQVESPPTTFGGILMRLGPGLIVAGSIVGSGELIATTATGAQAGFWLLWLILIGCVIKVFVQVELGRYSIVNGQTTMAGLNQVPGPVVDVALNGGKAKSIRGNWLVWYWFLMFMASLAQLGGIVGGVGQALAISAPLTEGGRNYNAYAESETSLIVSQSEWILYRQKLGEGDEAVLSKLDEIQSAIFQLEQDSNKFLLQLKQINLRRIESSKREADVEQKNTSSAEVAAIEAAQADLTKAASSKGKMQLLFAHASLTLFAEAKVNKLKAQLDKTPDDDVTWQILQQYRDNLSFLRRSVSTLEEETNMTALDKLDKARKSRKPPAPLDDRIWATIITAITVLVLINGRYGLIQSFATAMVALFTLITIVNLAYLQSNPSWGVGLKDIVNGMSFRLPPGDSNRALATALATFGIIGVGASELVVYPYWCIEKGYARFTGPRNKSPEWADRARGWMRVMRWDAWCSMVVYTFATIAFYLLGAAILGRTGLDPKGTEMIRYLSVMYAPVFGPIAQTLFLFGAFAVLYSTFFVANASLARVFSDVLRVLKIAPSGAETNRFLVRVFSGVLPVLCLSFYWTGWDPQQLVLISGLMQAMMLPMLAGAALYFRYYRCDERIMPGRAWDLFLWISAVGMLIAGVWAAWAKVIAPMLEK